MKQIMDAKSILTLKKTLIDKLIFERFSRDISGIDKDGIINFHHQIEPVDKLEFKVSLGVTLISESQYNIIAQISGIFELTEESVMGKKLLTNNAVAILFPYLRSQLTLLTSQPGFEPVILPVMNINALLNDVEDK